MGTEGERERERSVRIVNGKGQREKESLVFEHSKNAALTRTDRLRGQVVFWFF